MDHTQEQIMQALRDMGDDAATFFDKSPGTIKSWLATGNIPLPSVLRLMEHMSTLASALVQDDQNEAYVTDNITGRPVTDQFQSEVTRVLNELMQALDSLAARLNYLEGNGPPHVQQVAPPPAMRGGGVQWADADMRDSNVGSMVRPAGSNMATIATQPRVVAAPSADNKALPGWLRPRPLKLATQN